MKLTPFANRPVGATDAVPPPLFITTPAPLLRIAVATPKRSMVLHKHRRGNPPIGNR